MYTDYVIQEGDTLESIAINQNIPMFQLLALNGLEDAITLVPGNTLKIPNQFYSFIKYKVQKGDTLTSIAKEYETTVEILRQLNGLENTDFLYEDEELSIPKDHINVYFTKEEDTLQNISQKMKTSMPDLLQYNRRIFLLPSQVIVYPKR